MRLFGLNITRATPTERTRDVFAGRGAGRILANLLPTWNFGRELAQETDYTSLLKAYRSWIYVCANKNAVSVASVPLRLYAAVPEGKPNGRKLHGTRPLRKVEKAQLLSRKSIAMLPQVLKAADVEEVVEHPWLDLTRNVNNFMNQFDLWELTDLFEELCGNAYWYIIEDNLHIPREIWPVPPNLLKIMADPVKFIKGYVLVNGMQKEFFEEREIIHFKFPNPRSMYYGMSPLAAVSTAYNLNEHMSTYEQAVFANMGRLEGVFQSDDEVDDAEYERLKEELNQLTKGARNAGKTPLLPKGIKYASMGFGPRELSFLKGREKVKEEIANAYGQSMGMFDKDSTRANADAAVYTFQKDTVKPRLIRMEQKLNERLISRYDENLFVAFDDNVPDDAEFALKKRSEDLKNGSLAINEARNEDGREAWGPEFDEPWLSNTMAPASRLLAPPSEPTLPKPEDLEAVAEAMADGVTKALKGRTRRMYVMPSEKVSQLSVVRKEDMSKEDWIEAWKEDPHWAKSDKPSPLVKRLEKETGKEENRIKGNILEIGCGNGRDSVYLGKQGYTVVGIDISPDAVKIAKEKTKDLPNVRFEVGDAEKLAFPDSSFDAVYSLSVLHSTNLKKSIPEVSRVIKKDGLALLFLYVKTTYVNDDEEGPRTEVNLRISDLEKLYSKEKFQVLDKYRDESKDQDEEGKHTHYIVVYLLKRK